MGSYFDIGDYIGILNDIQIKQLINIEDRIPNPKKEIEISNGITSFGYDLTLAEVVEEIANGDIDPKNFDKTKVHIRRLVAEYNGNTPDYVILPPYSFVLAHSVEYLKIPQNVIGICVGKSTYARCGLVVNVTPLEPGWEGQVTLEIHNTSRCRVKLYLYEGICQVNFFKGMRPLVTYSDKKGKYQGQLGIVYPKRKQNN